MDEPLANALADQPRLRELVATPATDRVAMAIAVELPRVCKVTLVDADPAEESVAPPTNGRELRVAVFEDFTSERVKGVQAIPAGSAARKVSRLTW